MKLHATKLGIDIPIIRKHNHLVCNILEFPFDIHLNPCWKKLEDPSVWKSPHPELIVAPGVILDQQSKAQVSVQSTTALNRTSSGATGPKWLQAWRTMLIKLLTLPMWCLRLMSKMVRFKFCPREWLSLTEAMEEAQMHREIAARPQIHPRQCTHPTVRRSGNRYGRYAQCNQCGVKFQWNESQHGWGTFQPKSRQSHALLPPSLETMVRGRDPTEEQGQLSSFTKSSPGSTADSGDLQPLHPGRDCSEAGWDAPLHGGRASGHAERSGGIPSGLRRSGSRQVSPLRLGHVDDQWEFQGGMLVKHHRMPQKTLFLPDQEHCPIQIISRLLPFCNAKMTFENSARQEIQYKWCDLQEANYEETLPPWTGRTVFKISKAQPLRC